MSIRRKQTRIVETPPPSEQELERAAMERAALAELRATEAGIVADEVTARTARAGVESRVDQAAALAERAVHQAEIAVERATETAGRAQARAIEAAEAALEKAVDAAQREATRAVEIAGRAVAASE